MCTQPDSASSLAARFFGPGSPGLRLCERIGAGAPDIHAGGLRGAATSLLASQLFARTGRPVVLVGRGFDDARELYEELLFFRRRPGADDAGADVLLFPPLETQPYENVLSHCDISARRLDTLYRLCEAQRPQMLVTSARAAMQRVLPPEVLIGASRTVRRGEIIDRDALCQALIAAGYTRVSLVEDRGDLRVRGEVLDVFAPGYDMPVRLDFFGDCIESIRLFDPATQRSRADLERTTIVPVREVIVTGESVAAAERRLLQGGGDDICPPGKRALFCENLRNGLLPSGVEYSLSFLYPNLHTLFDYLSGNALVIWSERARIDEELTSFSAEVSRHYAAAREERRVASPPDELFVQCAGVSGMAPGLQQVSAEPLAVEGPGGAHVAFDTLSNDDIRADMAAPDAAAGALGRLAQRIEQWYDSGIQVCVVCHTERQCERLGELLAEYGLEAYAGADLCFSDALCGARRLQLLVGGLSRGFRFGQGLLALITEEELFGEKKRRIPSRRHAGGTAIAAFGDLKSGDYIVHRENGIGVYRGLDTVTAGGMSADYLSIEYAGGDKLYVPAGRIHLIAKYEKTDEAAPRLDKLGGTTWARTRKRVRESVEKVARDLVELYSARKVHQGHAFAAPDHYYREFEAAFPYEETPDQLAAIQDVMRDMSEPRPMDRLICGDVGYGKTEVALRAAFRCAMEGRQVALFVPTTVLAQQHYQTFTERFAGYPVRVDILSRFRNPADQKRIVQELAGGTVDIIIGTHRLISKDIVFKNLGLVIIDEEHRFGVTHKERLKKLRTTVDVLTLTATPIPRTLQLSLFGIRDFSIIETPPEDRLSIRTVITHFDDTVIRDAVLRELKRGGQVFFVHDRVRSIPSMAHYLQRLVPEMQLGIAHGQMSEHELERSMMQFIRKETNVLLCTTIIESGLDFPTANTIIINSAHRLGLAQMYQLRGRVGRGKVRAYAYMMVPGSSVMSRDAQRRLEALSEFTELGSGYRLATRDLQIRGAGNILGHSQSGHIASVGVDMYLELLQDAIASLKGEKPLLKIDPEINLPIQAYIPEEYVDDTGQRLVLYRRIAAVQSHGDVQEIEDELRDRFGALPPQVETLLETARLKIVLRAGMVTALDFTSGQAVFTFHAEAGAVLDRVIALVAADQKRFRITPDARLFARVDAAGGDRALVHDIARVLA